MKNIHVLPTDKPSRLVKQKYDTIDRLCLADMATKRAEYKRFNINITSDEEIKEGDWVLSKLNEIIKFHSGYDYRYYAKIILTTDQDLIKDGVQAIDDEFLEWFIKNSSCEEVEIVKDMELDYPLYLEYSMIYKIIIPKEEPKREFVNNTSKWNMEDFEEPKQETLEEVSERYANMQEDVSETIGKYLVKAVFKDGAYWNQERSYSEEEVISILLKYELAKRNKGNYWSDRQLKKWFEQFKNK